LKKTVANRAEETKLSKLESHLYYVSEEMRFWRDRLGRMAMKMQGRMGINNV
jgi:hypothetical protein